MPALDTSARKLVATSGANFWFPAVTDEELGNEQLLLTNYRRSLGQKHAAFAVIGVLVLGIVYSYVKGE